MTYYTVPGTYSGMLRLLFYYIRTTHVNFSEAHRRATDAEDEANDGRRTRSNNSWRRGAGRGGWCVGWVDGTLMNSMH